MHDTGENKVLFHFGLKKDLDRVLLLGPWSFDKYLLVLHKLNEGEAVTKVKFDRTSFWVQIHGLPTMCQHGKPFAYQGIFGHILTVMLWKVSSPQWAVANMGGVQIRMHADFLLLVRRGDVALSNPSMMHQTCQIPGNMQAAAFEKQLSEIDKALKGEAVFSEKPSSAKSVSVVAADLQNLAQSSRVDEESEKREEKVEKWVGHVEDLGSTIGPPCMSNITPSNINISIAMKEKKAM